MIIATAITGYGSIRTAELQQSRTLASDEHQHSVQYITLYV